MCKKQCKDCEHFLQHYALGEDRFFRVYCGHCTQPGVRRKRPDDTACDRFSPGLAEGEAFVSKKYLSKELLKYMLSLELLPEIEDAPPSLGGAVCNK